MKRSIFVLLISFFCTTNFFAQEGMWLLNQLDQLDLNDKGLQISTDKIYHPDKASLSDAILRLPGATGSFVSPNGLILTNHHVAYSAIQRASTKGEDFLTNGFLAKNLTEEIEAPGYTARLMTEMKDVTEDILDELEDIEDPSERSEKVNELIGEMTGEITDGKDDVVADVIPMYNGKQYILFVYKVYSDIRIVYAPPASIGNYGDEIDNWMWPRHTGDFTFLRCYMAPDGSGRKFHEENIPVKPKVWLQVSTGDLDDGDFNFVLGFPGSTVRYRTSNSVDWNLNRNYPHTINSFTEIISMIDEFSKESNDVKITLADFKAGLGNALKNSQGMVDGMKKTNFLQKKREFEKELMNFINNDENLKAKYGGIIENIAKRYGVLAATEELDNVLGDIGFLSGTLATTASNLIRFVMGTEGMDEEEIENEIEDAMNRYNISMMGYHEPFDKALLNRMLKIADQLPAGSRIEGLEYILNNDEKSIEEFVEEAYQTSKLDDPETFKSYLKMTMDEIQNINDPIINATLSLAKEMESYTARNRKFGAIVVDLRKQYIDAIYEWKGSGMYPDANFTMRFAYGYVRGYKPADAVWYYPFTTLSGVIEKNTGVEPFNAPDKLTELYKAKDFGRWIDPDLDDVPVAFTNILESTGGNSGSPVLNAKGEVIGALFDGNYEAMTSDWQYDDQIQRSITVDIRYVLFLAEKMVGADYLLEELGVK